ncbi:ACL156Wp [Eremothecium gossypii ATCC 10895]|uniref:ACL156Wp n=1 Tax=Eremothecium gossypii (strain ATCC 10895 / CBS 109.51 / FGSC 9923 / NRRL Y-1056) TaxID=284811 RepID=Q75CS5_EREGS|nr:ACL156Wp [Eremothecium gossypii ATCC 10895]AAS51072.1 ACL156Wp [Eremothecium gossypii ATCC 10895]AEY95362.1 FACL156Wp [Eremothecium gossypii FDAG1]
MLAEPVYKPLFSYVIPEVPSTALHNANDSFLTTLHRPGNKRSCDLIVIFNDDHAWLWQHAPQNKSRYRWSRDTYSVQGVENTKTTVLHLVLCARRFVSVMSSFLHSRVASRVWRYTALKSSFVLLRAASLQPMAASEAAVARAKCSYLTGQ